MKVKKQDMADLLIWIETLGIYMEGDDWEDLEETFSTKSVKRMRKLVRKMQKKVDAP